MKRLVFALVLLFSCGDSSYPACREHVEYVCYRPVDGGLQAGYALCVDGTAYTNCFYPPDDAATE